MPERWERELQRLRTVDPDTAQTWERAQRPPSGEGMPPRRQRVVAGVVAFAVFAAAGVFAWQALRPPGHTVATGPSGPTVTATFDTRDAAFDVSASGGYPEGRLSFEGEAIGGTAASFSWEIDGGAEVSDSLAPDFRAGDYLTIQRGSQLVIAGSASSVTGELQRSGTFPFDRFQDYGTLKEPITLDAPAGRYVLHLTPTWPQGSVPYYFPIELVEPPPATGSALVLDVVGGADGPEASIAWGDTSQTGVRSQYECDPPDPPGGCAAVIPNWGGPMIPLPYLSVPAGTPMAITGDVNALKGRFIADVDGRNAGPVTLAAPGSVPDVPGTYYLENHVAIDGQSTATFWFGVEVVPLATAGPSAVTPGGTSTPSTVAVPVGLVGPNWVLSKIDDTEVSGPSIPMAPDRITLTFSAERYSGSDGCNTFGGRYRAGAAVEPRGDASGSIDVVSLAGTQVACSGPVAMFTERMLGATDYFIEGDTLTIRSPGGQLTFEGG